MSYYTDTAYNSSKPRDLASTPEASTILSRSAKKHAINGVGQQCQEYFSSGHQLEIIELLNDTSPATLEDLNKPMHEVMVWASLKNPVVRLEMLKALAMTFLVFSILGNIFFLFDSRINYSTWIEFFLVSVLPLYFIYKLSKTAIKRGWVKDKNNIELNRRTGMITFTWKKKRVSYPFDEFDVSVQQVVGYAGNVMFHLFFIHRYTSQFFREPAGSWNRWDAEQEWEYWQCYMDVSRPLPDVPQMEPYRADDPVTAAWDVQHNRPKDYWKEMDEDTAKTMREKSKQSVSNFPWGATRDEALAMGWQASGGGEGAWLNNCD